MTFIRWNKKIDRYKKKTKQRNGVTKKKQESTRPMARYTMKNEGKQRPLERFESQCLASGRRVFDRETERKKGAVRNVVLSSAGEVRVRTAVTRMEISFCVSGLRSGATSRVAPAPL